MSTLPGSGRRPLVYTALALVLTVAALLLGPVPPAAAHSELESSNPANGSTVKTLPEEIRLTFNDSVLPQFATVAVEVDGKSPQKLRTRVTRSEVYATPPDLDDQDRQDWTLSYRIVSKDGHVVTGTVEFTVLAQPAPTPHRTATPSPTPPASSPSSPSSPPAATAPAAGPAGQDPPTERSIVLGAGLLGLLLIAPILITLLRRRPPGNRSRR